MSLSQTNPKTRKLIAPAISGRIVGRAIRRRQRTGKSSIVLRFIDNTLSSRISSLDTLGVENVAEVRTLYREVGYWHGTGRYQYRNRKQVDLLGLVVKYGGLQPHYDTLDPSGPRQIISTARSRMYARAYADMHGRGASETDRHGSSIFWAAVFGGDFVVEQVEEFLRDRRIWSHSGRSEIRQQLTDAGGDEWYKKVRTDKTSIRGLFHVGSDIPDNYPVLFGIRARAFEPVQQSRALNITEARSVKPLMFGTDISHIEVPRAKINETRSLLQDFSHTLPVFAIEDGERYSVKFKFSELVSGKMSHS